MRSSDLTECNQWKRVTDDGGGAHADQERTGPNEKWRSRGVASD